MTNHTSISAVLLTIAALMLCSTGASAQTVGSDDYEPPADARPGDATVQPPPVDDSGVHSSQNTQAPPPQMEIGEGNRTATVHLHHGADEDVDVSGIAIALHAVRPPGPMQPDHFRQVHATWSAITGDDGIAHFEDLPENLRSRGLFLQASATYGGLSFDSDYVAPEDSATLRLDVYDRTHRLPPIALTKKRLLITPWEEYLIFDQFWTFRIDGDRAFDIADSDDPALARGLPLRLPYTAEGISVAAPGEHEIINNIVYWKGVLTPGTTVTLQVRFSMSVRSSSFTFEQPMHYSVDDVQVLVPIDTQFERVTRLENLTLRAPGFAEVGTDPGVLGLSTPRDYLVAHGRSVPRGESYQLRIEGLPFSRPFGGWIALFGGILGFLFIVFYGRREYRAFRATQSQGELLKSLHDHRDQLFDELAELERELEACEDEEDLLDLEEEKILIRQRLALVLRKISDLESVADEPQTA